jgi:hypothetical protein
MPVYNASQRSLTTAHTWNQTHVHTCPVTLKSRSALLLGRCSHQLRRIFSSESFAAVRCLSKQGMPCSCSGSFSWTNENYENTRLSGCLTVMMVSAKLTGTFETEHPVIRRSPTCVCVRQYTSTKLLNGFRLNVGEFGFHSCQWGLYLCTKETGHIWDWEGTWWKFPLLV